MRQPVSDQSWVQSGPRLSRQGGMQRSTWGVIVTWASLSVAAQVAGAASATAADFQSCLPKSVLFYDAQRSGQVQCASGPCCKTTVNQVYNVPAWLRADSLAAGLTVHKLHAFCSTRTGCNVFSRSADLCCMLPDLYHPSRVPALILSQPTAATISLRNVASMQHMTFQGAPCQIIFVARFHWTSGISAGAMTLGSMTSCQGGSMMQVGGPCFLLQTCSTSGRLLDRTCQHPPAGSIQWLPH